MNNFEGNRARTVVEIVDHGESIRTESLKGLIEKIRTALSSGNHPDEENVSDLRASLQEIALMRDKSTSDLDLGKVITDANKLLINLEMRQRSIEGK